MRAVIVLVMVAALAGCQTSRSHPRLHDREFAAVDADRNGEITYEEYVAAYAATSADFVAKDHDGDGFLTPPEYELYE